jgi:hypothetical protein
MANFCESAGGNTGRPACDLRALVITGVIFSSKNAKIPAGTEDVKSFLQGKFKEVVKANRFFPAFDSLTITDSSEDAVIGTLAGGYSEKLRDGNAIYQFDYPFGLCKAKSLRQFDGWNGGVFLVSKEGYVIGRKQGNGDLAAFVPASVYTKSKTLGDGQNPAVFSLIINFGDSGVFLNTMSITEKIPDFDAEEFTGIIDVELSVAGQDSGYVDVLVQTKCDGVNLLDTYATELASAAAWKLISATTGDVATITSVAAQAGTKSFRVSTQSNNDTFKLSLADISTLETAGIEGYESNTITVTIPK